MPDPVDSFAMLAFLTLAIGGPLFGWWLMVADYRAHLRSLRRMMVAVGHYCGMGGVPEWVRHDHPPCFEELDLTPPVTRDEVLAAYRQRVKQVHPDHGGDRRQFDRLQQHFTEALDLAVEA